jgi:hypothetical protein
MKNKKIIFLGGLVTVLVLFEVILFLKNNYFSADVENIESMQTSENKQELSDKEIASIGLIEKNLFIENRQTPFNDYWEMLLLEGKESESLEGFYADYDKLPQYIRSKNLNQYQVENYMAIAETRSEKLDVLKKGLERFAATYVKKTEAGERNRAIALDRIAELNLFLSQQIMEDFLFKNEELLDREGSRMLDLTATWEGSDFRKTSRNLFSKAEILNTFPSLLVESLYFDLEDLLERKGDSLTEEDIAKLDLERRLVVIEDSVARIGEDNIGPYIDQFCPDRLFFYLLFKNRLNDRILGYNMVDAENENLLSAEEIKTNFERMFTLIEDYPYLKNKPEKYDHFLRFYYAIFLNNNYGEQKIDEIKKLLEPIYQMSGNNQGGIFVFLQKEAFYSNSFLHKKEISNLAKIDLRMGDMLSAAGWDLKE